MTLWKFLVNYSGLLSLVIVLVILLCKTWIMEKLKKGVEYDFDKKLESYKSDLTKEREAELEVLRQEFKEKQEVQALAASSYMAGQHSAHDKRIDSIDKLWKIIVESKPKFPTIFFMVDALSEEEFLKFPSLEKIKPHLSSLNNQCILDLIAHFDAGGITRPFVGEYLWSLYSGYYLFTKRFLFLMRDGISKGVIGFWDEDEAIKAFLKKVLTEDDLNFVQSFNTGKIQVIQGVIEKK